ncbi:MAG: elongation factor P [Nitrospirota bacterium]
MISTSEFRNGTKIELEGEPYVILEFLHVKPGKGGAFVRTKLKNLRTGGVVDRTFRSGEKVDEPELEEKEVQYLYTTGEDYFFMDTKTYEQLSLNVSHLGDSKYFLKENMIIEILYHVEKPIGIELPIFVELKVVKTSPGVRGDTASGGSKPAILETGATVKIPLHINEGDIIKIDTRTSEYIERVK